MMDSTQTQQLQPFDNAESGGETTQMIGSPQATQMAMSINCPVCRTDNPPGDLYCADCGFLLSSTPVEVEAPSVDVPGKLVDRISSREFALRVGENTIGRQTADVLLTDGSVSRQHAKLILSPGNCLIEDLGSSNGTYVDGTKAQPGEQVEAKTGSEIKFGAVALWLELAEISEPETEEALAQEEAAAVEEEPQPEAAVEGAEAAVDEPVAELQVALAKLIGVDGTSGEYPIFQGENTLGRRSENNIALSSDSYASGSHAVITALEEGISITDVGSSNGTLLNGDKLVPQQPADLRPGDELIFGQSKFKFELLEAE